MIAARHRLSPDPQVLLHGLERWVTPVLILGPVVDSVDGDDDFVILAANVSACDEFGIDVVGQRLNGDRPFGPLPSLASEVSLALLTDEVRAVDRRVAGPDDHSRHLRFTLLPSMGLSTMFVEDKTIEVGLRRQLAATGQMLARVERWGNLGVWELDLRSGSLYWSTQVFEILGLDEPSMDSFMGLVHAEHQAKLEHALERARTQAGPYRVTHRIMRHGEIRTLDQHMQSVLGTDGRPGRLLGTMIDVTASDAPHRDLHQTVHARAAGLLAGGIAHDLKNAMAIVAGHADVVLRQLPDDSPLRPSIEAVSRAGHRAGKLTRNLMNLGRASDLRPTLIDVSGLFDDVAQLVSASLNARIEIDLGADDDPTVVADRVRLEQVLVDLMLNAGDADASCIRLMFKTARVPASDPRCTDRDLKPGAYGTIRVVDDGTGMDSSTSRQAFDPYFTTKDAESGSGLGLANARAFAQQSGGLVEIDSALGHGTTLSIFLPRVDRHLPRRPESGQSRPIRILVGTADAGRADHLTAVLDANDRHQIVTAVDALTMSIILDTEPIDIVIVDDNTLDPDQLLSLAPSAHSFIVKGAHETPYATSGALEVIAEQDLHEAVLAYIAQLS